MFYLDYMLSASQDRGPTQWVFYTLVKWTDFYLTQRCWASSVPWGWAHFKKVTALPVELQGGSSANNSVGGRPVTQEHCSQRVFKSQSFRTQNTVFPTREVSDGYFLRAAHKSLLFHAVSERVHLHVLREEWRNMGQNSPPTVPGDNAFYLLWRQPPGLQWQEKETHSPLRGANPWYSLCRVNFFTGQDVLLFKVTAQYSGIKDVLNFLFFYYWELHYGHSTLLLDLEARELMIM